MGSWDFCAITFGLQLWFVWMKASLVAYDYHKFFMYGYGNYFWIEAEAKEADGEEGGMCRHSKGRWLLFVIHDPTKHNPSTSSTSLNKHLLPRYALHTCYAHHYFIVLQLGYTPALHHYFIVLQLGYTPALVSSLTPDPTQPIPPFSPLIPMICSRL
jgi:hypothetical protein